MTSAVGGEGRGPQSSYLCLQAGSTLQDLVETKREAKDSENGCEVHPVARDQLS